MRIGRQLIKSGGLQKVPRRTPIIKLTPAPFAVSEKIYRTVKEYKAGVCAACNVSEAVCDRKAKCVRFCYDCYVDDMTGGGLS